MQFLIQKKANSVNVIDTSKSNTKNILFSLPLGSACSQDQLGENLVFVVNENIKNVPFALIKTQDLAGQPVLWNGTIVELVNKINTEYFAGGNGLVPNQLPVTIAALPLPTGAATEQQQADFSDKITDYCSLKKIGKIFDLEQTVLGSWNGYPLNFVDPPLVSIIFTAGTNKDILTGLTASNAADLCSILNDIQSYFLFSVIDATKLLINDGTISINELQSIEFKTSNMGDMTWDAFADSPVIPLSNADETNENLKTLLAYQKAIWEKLNGSLAVTGTFFQATQPVSLVSDFYSNVSRSLIPGVANFKKQGFNSSVSTTQRMLNSGGTAIVPLTVAAAISFVSTGGGAGNDSAAGSGARTLLITGVDASGNYQTEVLALNGTTPVVTTKTWLGVLNRVQVLTAGTGQVNAGSIVGTSGGNTYCTMQPGICLMKQLCYRVPTGKTALIHSYLFDTSKNGGASIIFNIFFYVLVNGVKTEVYTWRMDAATASLNIISRTFECPIAIPAGTIWWIEASTSSGTGWLDGEIEQVIFDN